MKITQGTTFRKLTAVEYYLIQDKSQEEVCKIFNCKPRSLMRWVDKYQETVTVEHTTEN